MDTTLQRYQKMDTEQAYEQYKKLIDEAKAVDGKFCGIWHNQNLCEKFGWEGWRNLMERVIDYAVR